uniref:LRAT domain-containing protein n=1 Tax=Magallana gigas TaxID=29159 RepID=A0A8W8L6L5_MAGGI|nr:phospholipase A and acyltransferase 2 isoform X2 [Crassostrea gigas]
MAAKFKRLNSRKLDFDNIDVIQRARIGDQLEFHRGVYSHWAVYVGNEEVIHLAGINSTCTSNRNHRFTIGGKIFAQAEVKRESVWEVIRDSKVEINNDKDKSCRPLRPHEIVRKAMGMIGDIGYNVFRQNCEHFAAFCRYGVAWSKQADKITETIMVGSAIVAVAGLTYEFYKMFIKDD